MNINKIYFKTMEKINNFYLNLESKTGIDSRIFAWFTGTFWGLTIRAIICKLGNYDFWYPGFNKKTN